MMDLNQTDTSVNAVSLSSPCENQTAAEVSQSSETASI